MNKNKWLLTNLFVMALVILMTPLVSLADDAKARAIMVKVDARDDGDNSISQMEMILIDKRNNRRVRKIKIFTKYFGVDRYRLMFFLQPADVKDTGFLTYDYDDPEKDDDQWLYLPALQKTKRIAASDKSASFMGSDFNYSDMTKKDPEDYDYKLSKDSEVRGEPVWVIEAVPRTKEIIDETGYKKSWLLVRKDNYMVVRAVHMTRDGGKHKYLDVVRLKKIDGIWTGLETIMTTKKGKKTTHKTVLKLSNVRYNQKLDDNVFTVRRLEKGF